MVLAVPLTSAVKLFDDERLVQFCAASVPARAACLDLVLSALPVPGQRIALGIGEPLYASVHRQTDTGIVFQAARYLSSGEAGCDARPGIEAMLDVFQPGWRYGRQLFGLVNCRGNTRCILSETIRWI